jgi:hypothetical protein
MPDDELRAALKKFGQDALPAGESKMHSFSILTHGSSRRWREGRRTCGLAFSTSPEGFYERPFADFGAIAISPSAFGIGGCYSFCFSARGFACDGRTAPGRNAPGRNHAKVDPAERTHRSPLNPMSIAGGENLRQ